MPRYLVTSKFFKAPFFTDYFSVENFFNTDLDMVVYDLYGEKYMVDGINWIDIERDHL